MSARGHGSRIFNGFVGFGAERTITRCATGREARPASKQASVQFSGLCPNKTPKSHRLLRSRFFPRRRRSFIINCGIAQQPSLKSVSSFLLALFLFFPFLYIGFGSFILIRVVSPQLFILWLGEVKSVMGYLRSGSQFSSILSLFIHVSCSRWLLPLFFHVLSFTSFAIHPGQQLFFPFVASRHI